MLNLLIGVPFILLGFWMIKHQPELQLNLFVQFLACLMIWLSLYILTGDVWKYIKNLKTIKKSEEELFLQKVYLGKGAFVILGAFFTVFFLQDARLSMFVFILFYAISFYFIFFQIKRRWLLSIAVFDLPKEKAFTYTKTYQFILANTISILLSMGCASLYSYIFLK